MSSTKIKIGILALQGDFEKHAVAINKSGHTSIYVRTREDLDQCNGLIIPGGESTTIGRLLHRFDLLNVLKDKINGGMPVFGTCAGTILLAKDIVGFNEHRLGCLDICVERNAYGRQIESFECNLDFTYDETTYNLQAVFIRAPIIRHYTENFNVLAEVDGNAVIGRQDNILVATFHPELTDETLIHRYFLDEIVLPATTLVSQK